jgi:lipopolysaccharide export LptBFGC system permease protein LptF
MHPSGQSDALLDLLAPLWQFLIGATVAVVVAVVGLKLARRGRSRMRTAMVVVGAGIVGLALFGVLQATVTRG